VPSATALSSEKISATVRRNGWAHTKRRPAPTRARSDSVSVSRASWNGVRMRRIETSEHTYDAASTTNGTARPRPYSTPPRGGPARRTTARRACSAPAASPSCGGGTTDRMAPEAAGAKNAYPVPSISATATIAPNGALPPRRTTASAPVAAARAASAPTITSLRSVRSAAAPATRLRAAIGAVRANATTPAFAADPVSARVSRE
jgi:hypothetical protein